MGVKSFPKYVFEYDSTKPAVACKLDAVDGGNAAHEDAMINLALVSSLFDIREGGIEYDVVVAVDVVAQVVNGACT